MKRYLEIQERDKRTTQTLADPDTMNTITTHVSNGGSILDLATKWNVRFSDINGWIYSDPVRKKEYEISMNAQNEWAVQRILQEIKRLAFMDIRSLFNDNGTVKPMAEWSDDAAKAVIGLKHTDPKHDKDGDVVVPEIREIKLEKKLESLKTLGNCKELRLFADRIEHSGKITLLDMIEGSLKDAKETQAETPKA